MQVLCLDECTANVDPQTSLVLQNTIASECSGMTVIMIAHRISSISNLDTVFVLDHGELVTSLACFSYDWSAWK